MQSLKFIILALSLVAVNAFIGLRNKRDARSIINDALNLYYYGQNWKMPSITLNTKANTVCAASGIGGGYYLQDIIGQADNIASLQDCLAGCMNIPDCVAVNYIGNTRQCVALKSGTSDGSNLLTDQDLYQVQHYMFKDCKGKTPKPATKPPAGDPPKGCGLPWFQQNLLAGAKTRIVSGTEAIPYSYPWLGWMNYEVGGGMISTCGASLIMGSSATESDLAITAAHCVVNENKSDRDPSRFTINFGNHDNRFMESQEQKVQIKKVIYHKDYKTKGAPDIAMFKLRTPVKFNNYIRPICLAGNGASPKDGKQCVAAGWGRLYNTNQTTPNRLQQTILPIVDDNTCGNNNVWGVTFDKSSMICAGNLAGTTSTCQGDSGGPLACFEDGHWTLYGATSFGSDRGCAVANKPSVFVRISALRPWIDATINDLKKA